MKYILVTLLAISKAANVGHHDDTFYEEYVVGGHSHPDDGTETAAIIPERPTPPNIFDEYEFDHGQSLKGETQKASSSKSLSQNTGSSSSKSSSAQ